MNIQKSRWSKVYESSEEELLDLFEAMNLDSQEHHLDEFSEQDITTYNHEVRLWCADGSAVVTATNKPTSIQPGDTIKIPAQTPHQIAAGIAGCTWYQTVHTALEQ